jgi:uncharacterized protein
MSDEVLGEMTSQYLGLRFPQSVFSWQGGEPTLCGLSFYKRAVEFQMKYGANGQVVGNSLQTNGLLLNDEWCRFFNRYKFFIGLSLDGPKELHDKYRKGIKGSSWERGLKAAELLSRHSVEFNILSVVTGESEKRAKEIFRWFLDNGFKYLQFIPCVEVSQNGGITPYSVTPQGFGRFLCELFDLWWMNKDTGISLRIFDAVLQYLVTGESGMCIFSSCCDGYVVVEHDGSVYPCDFFVRKDARLGRLTKTPLDELYKSEKYRKFGREKSNIPDECRSCEFFSLCNGGCRKDRTNFRKTYLCPAYKMFFAHALNRLKYLSSRFESGRRDSRPAEGRAWKGDGGQN